MIENPVAFVCGFSEDDSGGIYSFELEEESGSLQEIDKFPLPAVAYLTIHPEGSYLYSVNRVEGGQVTSFHIDEFSKELTELNRQPSCGEGPAYISVDTDGRYAFVANYTSGTIAMLPIEVDGRLGEPSDIVEHNGSSVHPDRQTEPHPHSIRPGPNDQFVFVTDLGTDTVEIYEVDYENGKFQLASPSPTKLHDGAGPRHLDFHPNEEFAYVINELDSTITVFDYDFETGVLDEIETARTIPKAFDEDNYSADIHVHPSGQWLYGSNRGHNSIYIASIDDQTGHLDVIDYEPSLGEWPWNFAIDPTGGYILVENRDSESIVIFEIDETTGEIAPTGYEQNLPQPVCMQFL